MSASSARKKRLEQANQPVAETKKQKKKLSQGWIFGICICLIVALLVGGILVYRTVRNNRTVLTVGDHKVSVKEFNYFYNSAANSLSSYAATFGIQTGVPLDEQYVSSNAAAYLGMFGFSTDILTGKESVDDVYDVTWAQMIANTAKDNAITSYTIYNAAMADENFKIDDHLQHEIDEAMETMQGYADANGESLSSLIKRVFGSGCSVSGYRHYLEVTYVAGHYTGRTYTDDEIAARYNESPEDFAFATYYLYSVSAADFAEEEVPEPTDEEGNVIEPTEEDVAEPTDEEGNVIEPTEEDVAEPEETEEAPELTEAVTEEEPAESEATEEATEPEASEEEGEPTEEEEGTEPTEEEGEASEEDEEAKRKAEEAAKAMEQDFDADNEKVAVRTDNTRENVTANVNEEAAAWLFDTAKDGDVKLFENSETGVYYVIKLINKDDYQTINGLELAIAADAEDAELAEGELTAAEKVEKIKAALEADSSEANFRALMEEYGAEAEDIKNLTRSGVAGVSNDVLMWYMEEAEAGKWIATELDSSTLFLYCTGFGDSRSRVAVTSKLNSEWSESAIAAAKEACGYDEAVAMTANVRLSFSGS